VANPTNNSAKIAEEIKRRAGQGLKAATIFLSSRIKEILSVPAPRKLVKPKYGAPYYRATTPATPGAPPRKLSGQLRRSIAWEMRQSDTVGRVGTNMVYARRLEAQGHRFLTLAVEMYQNDIKTIMGRAFQVGGNI